MNRRRKVIGLWVVNLKEGDQLEDLFVDERVILKLILKKWDWREETLLMWP
jgi:hypothetical protein